MYTICRLAQICERRSADFGTGLLGELMSGALNIIGFSWMGSPAATELETVWSG